MHVQLYNAPRSAGSLPVTRHTPYSQTSIPALTQPRNMTGIYLGLEGNVKPPRPKTGVPPLARSRGSASRMKTPTEEQRYKKVELLRIKEEKRGFSGNPVKRHQQPGNALQDSIVPSSVQPGSLPHPHPQSTPHPHSYSPFSLQEGQGTDSYQGRRWGPGKRIDPSNLDDLLRPNPRNFTTVSNSGVTRSEKLTGWLGGGVGALYSEHLPPAMGAREVERISNEELAGLEECFRKVCKGNVEVLYSLLPGRKPQPRREHANTGFTVRSYRNPKQAEILADFTARAGGSKSDRGGRPKTVPSRRPIVPQPYFFRHHSTHPGADAIAAQHRQLGHHSSLPGTEDVTGNYFNSTSKILASPGAGSISRSLHSCLQSPVNLNPASSAAGGSLHGSAPARHTTSPTDDLDRQDIAPIIKGFQSDASTSRTAQDSEVSGATQSHGGAAAATGAGEAESDVTAEITNSPEVHVAVVPTARPLDSTVDSNTTLDDSVTPRPLPDLSVTSDTPTPRPLPDLSVTSDTPTPRPAPEDDQSVSSAPGDSVTPRPEVDDSAAAESIMADNNNEGGGNSQMPNFANVTIYEDDIAPSTTEDQKPRPKLTASNSGADIMLGLETEEGQSAEVEIDTADQEELMPEAEAPKGRLRKASITEKVIKTKASEAIAAMIKEEAESRQRDFEKLLDEHAELVQEISRTPSSENLIQGERDH